MSELEFFGLFLLAAPVVAAAILKTILDLLGKGDIIDRHLFAVIVVISAIGLFLFLIGTTQPKKPKPLEQLLQLPRR